MARLIMLLLVLAFANSITVVHGDWDDDKCSLAENLKPRPHSVSILEFGAVGDGKTLNTVAFQNAIFYLTSFADKGGAQLYVPKGRWLTESVKITSHLTIFLDRDATIIGTQDISQWPIVGPLPSYGEKEEASRYRSLIYGYNLTDVVITGDNGTIDGQGNIWWKWFSQSQNIHPPNLVELVNAKDVIISNLTLLDAPTGGIHPVYCSDVHLQNITLAMSFNSSLTSGIIPDSCSNLCIENCNISVGQDAIALKSGVDQYGISYGKPLFKVYIHNVQLQASSGSALVFGSEMSGGILNVHANALRIHDSSTGVAFKTTEGRGGFVRDVVVSDVEMENVQMALQFTGHCGSHPDDHYDPNALPVFDRITLKNIVGNHVSIAGRLFGIADDPFTAICLSNIHLSIASGSLPPWACSDILGFSESVFPEPCPNLQTPNSNSSSLCFSLRSYNGLAAE